MDQVKSTKDAPTTPFPLALFWILLAYFAVQLVLRTVISSSADLDEADQLILTQQLHWGYGPQPPLYTWIQIGFFKAFGLSIFSLSLFKNLLLLCTYLLTYFCALEITGSSLCGIASAASLLFIPQIAWESQRDLTHSVLASTLAMATWFCLLRMRSKPRLLAYVALGSCIGFGLLSKYNFAVFLMALVLALLSVRQFRAVLLNWRMAVAGVVAVLIVSPNALWILHHKHLTLLATSKFGMAESESWIHVTLLGMFSVLKSTFTFLGPFVLILAVIFFDRSKPSLQRWNDSARLMFRTLIFAYALIICGIVLFHATDIRDRWLQPILVFAPVLTAAALQHRMDSRHLKRILVCASVVMIAVPIGLAGRIIFAAQLHRSQPLNKPYDSLAAKVRDSLRGVTVVITDSRVLGGNLRLNIPGKTFVTPELAPVFLPKSARPAYAWDATRKMDVPEVLTGSAAQIGRSLTNIQAEYFVANYKYGDARQMKIGIIVPREN